MSEPGEERHQVTVHQAVGGDEFFVELVERFYAGVAADPVLRPMYPEEELDGAKRRLAMFLVQFWGGSQAYSEERGHPRLRMRHMPFSIGPAERDAWFRHMMAALNSLVDERDVLPEAEKAMRDYFQMSAEAMRNAE